MNETTEITVAPPASQRKFTLLSKLRRLNWIFILSVIVPTIASIIYFGLVASDRYISESRFVVSSPQRQTASSIFSNLLQSTGISHSLQDAYAVHDYILSRDALAELDKDLQVGKAFRKGGLDIVHYFPGLDWDDSFEALYRYYPKRVTVEIDSTSTVIVLKVSAFTAKDSYMINETLLKMSERLVNKLNERAQQDTIAYARGEVREAERRAKDAAFALASFRNQRAVIDPEKQSSLQLQGVLKLQEELISAKMQLSQLVTYTPNNPQIPSLRTRIETLQKEINAESAKVTGGTGSLANKASDYERLALERAFADKQLAGAMAALETARNEAQRQALYLERVAQPNLPDTAIEPRRLRSILTVFVLGLFAWGILSLLIASVREHLD